MTGICTQANADYVVTYLLCLFVVAWFVLLIYGIIKIWRGMNRFDFLMFIVRKYWVLIVVLTLPALIFAGICA